MDASVRKVGRVLDERPEVLQDPDVTGKPGTVRRKPSPWPAAVLCAAAITSPASTAPPPANAAPSFASAGPPPASAAPSFASAAPSSSNAGPSLASAGPAAGVLDLDGRAIDLFEASRGAKVIVLLFTSVECPISNRYAPVVADLHRTFATKGVRFWLVYPTASDTGDSIQQHLKAFSYPIQAVRDPGRALARWANVGVTPEAAVYDSAGHQLYRGRIDNRYVNLAVERPMPTRHDLEDALSAALAGRTVAQPITEAVGCFIE